ncbi:phage tail fiber protein [Acinetobacter colistiniresistens]|uniref:phage tail fiber protein n=1 Tax=Acinetobacter colistiniresistens TaxID=280145 RepID=UPI0012501807|nr:hypothetical protein [Acinetobacter colistiniresistens]
MTIQTANLGTAPTGEGGDTFRSTAAKYNENFTNQTHAASRYVGTAAGNVMEVGAFGFGGAGTVVGNISNITEMKNIVGGRTRVFRTDGGGLLQAYAPTLYMKTGDTNVAMSVGPLAGDIKVLGWTDSSTSFTAQYFLRTSTNTTVDSNGFVKAASPIVKLFADKIDLNDEAAEQQITFEKVAIGHYLIKGSTGLAHVGWYIETPKDANGNILFAVLYELLENGDIEVKTYKKKFEIEQAAIVADLDKPIDITQNRWIDIRLQELPQKEISVTPPSFQPTNLSQAVAAAMGNSDGVEQ